MNGALRAEAYFEREGPAMSRDIECWSRFCGKTPSMPRVAASLYTSHQ